MDTDETLQLLGVSFESNLFAYKTMVAIGRIRVKTHMPDTTLSK